MRINKQIDPLEKAKKHNRKPGLPFINTDAGNVQQSIGMFNGSMADGGIGMCEQLNDDVLNDLASLPKLANDEYYHIGNIVGDTDFKQEGFHITKDINQCVYIKDQKHPEARYLYKVKFTPKNGIYFEDETGGWRARDIAGMILYNLGEQDVDEAHKIKGKNISKDLLNYRGQLRSLQMNNVTSEKGFREIAKILNDCGYDFIQYINKFETDEGKETPTIIPLKTNLQYEIIYDFGKNNNEVKTKMNEEYNVYNVTTLEDVIDGMIDNASEESIDKTLKLYNKIMRFFGKKANGDHYDEVSVYVDSDWTYDPESYVDVEAFDMEKKPSPIKDIRLYQFGLTYLLVEEFNDNIFIYTDSEDTLYDYLRIVDDYNNGELDNKPSEFNFDFEEEDNEALNEEEENEAVSGKYSDRFRRLVDKGRKEEDVTLVSEVANKVLDYLPEQDAEDLWKDKDFDEVEAKFVLDEGLFDTLNVEDEIELTYKELEFESENPLKNTSYEPGYDSYVLRDYVYKVDKEDMIDYFCNQPELTDLTPDVLEQMSDEEFVNYVKNNLEKLCKDNEVKILEDFEEDAIEYAIKNGDLQNW